MPDRVLRGVGDSGRESLDGKVAGHWASAGFRLAEWGGALKNRRRPRGARLGWHEQQPVYWDGPDRPGLERRGPSVRLRLRLASVRWIKSTDPQ